MVSFGARKRPLSGVNPQGEDIAIESKEKKTLHHGRTIITLLFLLTAAILLISAQPDGKNKSSLNLSTSSSGPSYISVIIPSVVDEKKRHRRLKAISGTWATDSRSIFVVHNLTAEYPDNPYPVFTHGESQTVPSQFPYVFLVPPHINDKEGFARLEMLIRHVYDFHSHYIFLVNDHSYVIPEHLCHYMTEGLQQKSSDLYAGHAFVNPDSSLFNTGAAGYLLSRTTMGRLIEKWNENKCLPGDSQFLKGNPDLVVSGCLQHELNVPAIDTRDNQKHHRFHSFGIVRTVTGDVDEWYIKVHERFGEKNVEGFDTSYQTLLFGPDCCSEETISFHYVDAQETTALFHIRKVLLEKPQTSNDDLEELVRSHWPTDNGQLGGYARKLPPADSQQWKDTLQVLRKISNPKFERKC